MPRTSSTTSSEAGAETLASFGLRVAIFFAPLVGGFVFMLASLYPTGELWTPDRVVAIQKERNVLYLPEFHKWPLFFPRYHLEGASQRHPEVLVLGSSRVKTVRSAFFRNPAAQFNAGMPGHDNLAGNAKRVLEAMPQDALPKYVFVDIDPWSFRSTAPVEPPRDFMEYYSSLEIVDFAWRRGFWWSLAQLRKPPPAAPENIGVQARRERSGLRPDGSLYMLHKDPEEDGDAIKRQIDEGKTPFIHDVATPSAAALATFDEFLSYCDAHGIKVIGFISSFKPMYYRLMREERRIDYFWNVGPALAPLFAKHHDELFDFLDPATVSCTDGQFLDPMHQSEVCTVQMLQTMAKQSPTVASLVDVGRLSQILEHPKSEWELDF